MTTEIYIKYKYTLYIFFFLHENAFVKLIKLTIYFILNICPGTNQSTVNIEFKLIVTNFLSLAVDRKCAPV